MKFYLRLILVFIRIEIFFQRNWKYLSTAHLHDTEYNIRIQYHNNSIKVYK